MIVRRLALAVGLACAGLASQLPEFTQQYRQRLGGAIDELGAVIAAFDSETGAQAMTRDQGIARLKGNGDTLARQRGADVETVIARKDRLERQRAAFTTAGPLSQYAVFAEDFDSGIARGALADFEPAVPVTVAGFVSAAAGLLFGWLLVHVLGLPLRRPSRAAQAATWR